MSKPLTISAITRRGLILVQEALAHVPEGFAFKVTSKGFTLLNSDDKPASWTDAGGPQVVEGRTLLDFAQSVEGYLNARKRMS